MPSFNMLLPASSVALQAGNAAIAFGGLQRLRVEQLAWDLPMSPGLRGHPSRRRIARRIAHIHNSSLDISAAFHSDLVQQAQRGQDSSMHPDRAALITSAV